MSRYTNNKGYVYGFEGYTMCSVGAWLLKGEETAIRAMYGGYVYYPLYNNSQDNFDIVDHKELLDTAEKVYVHPSCKLSRTMIASKYKKSLNPWLSDAVVIPDKTKDVPKETVMLFVNEEKKIMLIIPSLEYCGSEIKDLASSIKIGTAIKDLGNISNYTPGSWGRPSCAYDDVLDCVLMFYGEVYHFYGDNMYMLDVLTNVIPSNKTVFESTIQSSLGSDENKLTCDSLISISEMINSTDENTVFAGLKALSMMDWMHYPNSITAMFNSVNYYRWYYNNATHSTSVKYMFSQIFGSKRKSIGGSFGKSIYEDDFNLLKEFVSRKNNYSEEDLNNYLRYLNFMRITPDGLLSPNLKK